MFPYNLSKHFNFVKIHCKKVQGSFLIYIVPKLSRFFQDILQVVFPRQEMALVMWSKNVYQICEKNCLSISCEQKIRIEGPGIVRHFFFTYLIYIFWSHRQRHLLSWKQNLQNVLEFSWKFSHYILGSAKTCARGPSNRWRLLSLFTLDGWPFDTFWSRTRFTFFVHKKLIDKFFSRTRGNFSHNQKLPPW